MKTSAPTQPAAHPMKPFSLCGHRALGAPLGGGTFEVGERYLEGECLSCCPRCLGFGVVEITRRDGSLKRDGERAYHDCTCVDGKMPGAEPAKYTDTTQVEAGDANPTTKEQASVKVWAKKPIGIDELIDKVTHKYRVSRGEADSIVRRCLNHGYIRAVKDIKQGDLMRQDG